jgi:hypothetical protein
LIHQKFFQLSNHLRNIFGWRTDQKVVVIESDDWGSIRMSSKSACDRLRKLGHPVDKNPYHLLDGLETNSDIQFLAEILKKKSFNGRNPKITLNNSTANPDFTKIKDDNFQMFYREPCDLSYQRYKNSDQVIFSIKQGISEGVFDVQYHGAEHLQSVRWMKALREDKRMERQAFDVGVFSPAIANSTGYSMEYMDALDYDSKSEITHQKQYLKEGYDIFKSIWGHKAKSFIAPCYRWSTELERTLLDLGILNIQGQRAQLSPKDEIGYKQRKIYHYTGERNELGQVYTIRNVIFEPSYYGFDRAINGALSQIEAAFFMRVPAIISSHRINYTSRLSIENRDQGIAALTTLLDILHKKYPDLIFMGSSELGNIIKQDIP